MKVPGITLPDVPEAGKIDGDEMLLVLENSELRLKTIDMAKGIFKFPSFAPRIIPALVVSSTAACTSGVVTVTATAHGIPATVFDGYEVYYPGSPSLAAGWYTSLARTSADALTFFAPSSADFTSESVNSAAIVTDEVTIETIDLPANAIRIGDIVSVRMFRHGDALSSLKVMRVRLNTTILVQHNVSTSAMNGIVSLSFAATKTNKQDGVLTVEGTLTNTRQPGTLDTSTAQTLSVTGQLSAAGQYIAIAVAKLRIE